MSDEWTLGQWALAIIFLPPIAIAFWGAAIAMVYSMWNDI